MILGAVLVVASDASVASANVAAFVVVVVAVTVSVVVVVIPCLCLAEIVNHVKLVFFEQNLLKNCAIEMRTEINHVQPEIDHSFRWYSCYHMSLTINISVHSCYTAHFLRN